MDEAPYAAPGALFGSPVEPDPDCFARDEWHWAAILDDGSVLREFDHDPTGAGFALVPIERCIGVLLEPNRPGLVPHVVQIDRQRGQRAIYFRRGGKCFRRSLACRRQRGQRPMYFRRRTTEAPTGDGPGLDVTYHVIGWQETVEGRNVAHYTFVLPDGRCLHTTDPYAL